MFYKYKLSQKPSNTNFNEEQYTVEYYFSIFTHILFKETWMQDWFYM